MLRVFGKQILETCELCVRVCVWLVDAINLFFFWREGVLLWLQLKNTFWWPLPGSPHLRIATAQLVMDYKVSNHMLTARNHLILIQNTEQCTAHNETPTNFRIKAKIISIHTLSMQFAIINHLTALLFLVTAAHAFTPTHVKTRAHAHNTNHMYDGRFYYLIISEVESLFAGFLSLPHSNRALHISFQRFFHSLGLFSCIHVFNHLCCMHSKYQNVEWKCWRSLAVK